MAFSPDTRAQLDLQNEVFSFLSERFKRDGRRSWKKHVPEMINAGIAVDGVEEARSLFQKAERRLSRGL
jgi:hypothetical protein